MPSPSIPPLMNCGGVGRGGSRDSNADGWGDQFAVWVPGNQLASGGEEAVGGAGHDGPIGTFVGAFGSDASNGGGNPKRSAREIIVSPVRESADHARHERKKAACAAFFIVWWRDVAGLRWHRLAPRPLASML